MSGAVSAITGNLIISGGTFSSDFPVVEGSYDTSFNGNEDIFVLELDVNGTSLKYSTFVGGSSSDGYGAGSDNDGVVCVDMDGCVYVTGETFSEDFPVTEEAYDSTHNGFYQDVFLFKLSSDGSQILYSTFIGGNSTDDAEGIYVDNYGHIYYRYYVIIRFSDD